MSELDSDEGLVRIGSQRVGLVSNLLRCLETFFGLILHLERSACDSPEVLLEEYATEVFKEDVKDFPTTSVNDLNAVERGEAEGFAASVFEVRVLVPFRPAPFASDRTRRRNAFGTPLTLADRSR